jgi:hypothetical protein
VIVKFSVLGSSLKPQGKVHFFIMNALCKLLFHRKHPKQSYKHYFFSKVGVSVILLIFCQLYIATILNKIKEAIFAGFLYWQSRSK